MTPAYFADFPNIALQRDARGILEMRLHTQGGPLKFSAVARSQLLEACHAVGRDRDNRVVIFTGTGDTWCGEFDPDPATGPDPALTLAQRWDKQFWEGRKLLQNMLDVEVPMIAAVNGPALIHSEYLLTCDIILSADNAAFQDHLCGECHKPSLIVPWRNRKCGWGTKQQRCTLNHFEREFYRDGPRCGSRGRRPGISCTVC